MTQPRAIRNIDLKSYEYNLRGLEGYRKQLISIHFTVKNLMNNELIQTIWAINKTHISKHVSTKTLLTLSNENGSLFPIDCHGSAIVWRNNFYKQARFRCSTEVTLDVTKP